MTEEVFEQRELTASHRHRRSTDAHFAGRRVESEITRGKDIRSLGRAATGQGAQPCEQLREGERLDEVVVGADIEATDAIVDRIARREQQDRRPVARGAELAAEAEPVAVGEHHVEDEDVVDRFRRQPAGVLDRARRIDRIAVAPQSPRDQAGEPHVIFQQQHLHQRPR